MTQAEFYEAQRKARDTYRANFRSVRRAISRVYISAAEEVAERIKTLETKLKGDSLTAKSLRILESTLKKTGARIASETEIFTVDVIDDGIYTTNKPHIQYLKDSIKLADIDDIEFSAIEKIYGKINEDLINLTYTRLFDGYTFEQRIWGAEKLPGLSQRWQTDIKNIVTFGLAQGRDVLKIAQDITFYAAHGREKLIKRYGDLVEGTKTFSKRIPSHVDWRALRIARSELYISLQDASKLQGSLNPAVLEYKWNLTAGASHDTCICPDLAADSPYNEFDLPDYPHSNCLCWISQKIKGRDEFVQDLIDWGKGQGVPYLDNWYTQKYSPFIV